MGVFVCMCACVCVHVYVHACVCACVCVCMCACVYLPALYHKLTRGICLFIAVVSPVALSHFPYIPDNRSAFKDGRLTSKQSCSLLERCWVGMVRCLFNFGVCL